MNATRRVSGIVVIVMVAAGCSTQQLKPGVTYEATAIAKGDGGTPTPQGSPVRVESAPVQSVSEIAHDGNTLTILIRKTEHERGTFEITFPDKTSEMVRIKNGETKDVLPKGQKIGVRIEVIECR